MKILIIIPAFNEEKNIVNVVDYLIRNYPQYDYIVINDGSSDTTAELCKKQRYHFLSLPTNLGLADAFQTGMQYAFLHNYDAAIQFDADGQHHAEYIETMIDFLVSGSDIVIGSRFLVQRRTFSFRMLGSFLISFCIRITTGERITDPTSGMRMYNRKIIREFAQNINFAPEPDTISYLLRRGAKVSEIQVTMSERKAGKSYLTFSRSISYMLRMTISILVVQWFRGKAPFKSLPREVDVRAV